MNVSFPNTGFLGRWRQRGGRKNGGRSVKYETTQNIHIAYVLPEDEFET